MSRRLVICPGVIEFDCQYEKHAVAMLNRNQIALVMGGIFFGIFTPTEAAATGAFMTLLIAVLRGQLTRQGFAQSLADTTKISCMIMVIVTGAVIFGHFMAIARIPYELAERVSSLPLPRHAIIGVIIFVYLIVC